MEDEARPRGHKRSRGSMPDWVCEETDRRRGIVQAGQDAGLGIPALYWGVTFENTERTDDNGDAIDQVKAWTKRPRGMLTILGPVGTGKTRSAAAALHALYVRGADGFRRDGLRFLTAAGFVAMLRRAGFEADVERERIARWGLLALDDLGTEHATEWTRGQVIALLIEREANKRATIITSNLSLDEIARAFDNRLASRLAPGKAEVKGKDWRLSSISERVGREAR